MSTHNICFYEDLTKIIIKYHQILTLFLLLKGTVVVTQLCRCVVATTQLISAFVLAYAKSSFSHDAAQLSLFHLELCLKNQKAVFLMMRLNYLYFI